MRMELTTNDGALDCMMSSIKSTSELNLRVRQHSHLCRSDARHTSKA